MRLDTARLIDEQRERLHQRADEHQGRGAHLLHVCSKQRIRRQVEDASEEIGRRLRLPAEPERVGRPHRPANPVAGRRAQASRRRERIRGGCVSAPSLGAGCSLLEEPCRLLVRPGRSRGEVPGDPVALVGTERSRERPVSGAPFDGIGDVVGGRAQERMAKLHPARADRDEALPLGGVERARRQAHASEGERDLGRISGVARGGDEQCAPGLVRQRLQALCEGSFDAAANGDRSDDRRRAPELGVGERRDRLEESERVPGRVGDETLADARADCPAGPGHEILRSVGLKSSELESLDPGRLEPGSVTHRQQEHDALAAEPAASEQERLARRRVEPLGVVHDGEHGRLLGSRREQADRRRGGREPVARRRRSEGEGAGQRRGLRLGDAVEEGQERPQQIGEPGERQLGLGLERPGTQNGEPGRRRGDLVEEGGLPDPGIAVDDQRRAHAATGTVQQPVDPRNLIRAPG